MSLIGTDGTIDQTDIAERDRWLEAATTPINQSSHYVVKTNGVEWGDLARFIHGVAGDKLMSGDEIVDLA